MVGKNIQAHHQILLRGAVSSANRDKLRPTILEMKEQDFVTSLLNDLRQTGGKTLKVKKRSKRKLRLFQPVHRVFHPILLEACCSQPGEPRLDPSRIIKAGAVIRRRKKDGTVQGWMKQDGKILGWQTITSGAKAGKDEDPDPQIRHIRKLGKNKDILQKLGTENKDRMEESSCTLFTATPDICSKWGKTFIYGLLPLTSSERPDNQPDSPAPFSQNDLVQVVPDLLQPGAEQLALTKRIYIQKPAENVATTQFLELLNFLGSQLGLFQAGMKNNSLVQELQKANVQIKREVTGKTNSQILNFYYFLSKAYQQLIEKQVEKRNAGERYFFMPEKWPTITAQKKHRMTKLTSLSLNFETILAAVDESFQSRWQLTQPAAGRFDDSNDRYEVSCFVRLKCGDCPPETIWTKASEQFAIIPWYESSGAPPIQIELPEINLKTLKKLKPDVVFKVPTGLRNILAKIKMDKILDGKSSKANFDCGMICGFNIPIITICAFILLQIILNLLHIVFRWLPFVRICLPLP